MKTAVVLTITGCLALTWALLWRVAWVADARRRDAARIHPIRYRKGWDKANEKGGREFRARRDAETAAIEAFKHELRSEKPRLHMVS